MRVCYGLLKLHVAHSGLPPTEILWVRWSGSIYCGRTSKFFFVVWGGFESGLEVHQIGVFVGAGRGLAVSSGGTEASVPH